MTKNPINIVFFPLSANFGLAGTNRLQNIIYYLKKEQAGSVFNIALEDKAKLFEKDEDVFIKEYKEIYYGPSLYNFFKHIFQTGWYLLKYRKGKQRNVLYFYGEIDLKNFFFVTWARLLGYKVVIDIVEDLDAHTKFRSFKNKIKYKSAVFFRKRLDRFADGFTAVSSHLANKFKDKFPGVPLFFLPVTINSDLLKKDGNIVPHSDITLFYSGSFNEKDGLPFLLEGMYLAKNTGKKFRLMLSGKGTAKEMDIFYEEVKKYGLENDIDYKGFLTRKDYVNILSNVADVMCMTRINSAYANAGFPFKLGEFLASGKPVIASKVGDVEKYLTTDDAYLVEPEQSWQIRDALANIAEHQERAREIGLNGQKVAMKYFDHEKYATGLKDFITEKIWA